MSKRSWVLTLSIVGLLGLSGAILLLRLALADPARHTALIEQLVNEHSPYQLRIAGDVQWRLRPEFGLEVRDAQLSNPASPQELASAGRLFLQIAPLSLFGDGPRLTGLVAEQAHLNWFVGREGQSNWLRSGDDNGSTRGTAPSDSGSIDRLLSPDTIHIRNASASIRDLQRGIDTSLEQMDIRSRGGNLEGAPSAINLSSHWRRTNNQSLPVQLEAESRLDWEQGELSLDDIRFTLSPLVLQASLQLREFRNDLQWTAALESNQFNLLYLLEQFMPLDTAPGMDLDNNQFQFSGQLEGDRRGLSLNRIELQLDSMQADLTGDIAFTTDEAPLGIGYQLAVSALEPEQLAALLPERDALLDEDRELPFDWLQNTRVRGSHSVTEMGSDTAWRLQDIEAELLLDQGELAFVLLAGEPGGGALSADLRLDTMRTPAALNTRSHLDDFDMDALPDDIALLQAFSGRLQLESEHVMHGDTFGELRESAMGITRLEMQEGQADLSLPARIFNTIAVISPTGALTDPWPDTTSFMQLEARHLMSGTDVDEQQFWLRMDNLEMRGQGRNDSAAFDFDSWISIMGEPAPQTLPMPGDYQNIRWPLRCRAEFGAGLAQYCSPDMQEARSLLSQISDGSIERRDPEAEDGVMEAMEERFQELMAATTEEQD